MSTRRAGLGRDHATNRATLPIWVVRFLIGMVTVLLGACGGGDSTKPEPETNHPPIIAQQPDTATGLGSTLVLNVHASDVDGDSITFTLKVFLTMEEFREGYRPDAQLSNAEDQFTYRPSSRDLPGREFEFLADDQRGGRDSTRFYVAVQ